jgi:hypothetical protein
MCCLTSPFCLRRRGVMLRTSTAFMTAMIPVAAAAHAAPSVATVPNYNIKAAGAVAGTGGAHDRRDAGRCDPALLGGRRPGAPTIVAGVVSIRVRRPCDVRRGIGRGFGQSGLHRIDDLSRNGARFGTIGQAKRASALAVSHAPWRHARKLDATPRRAVPPTTRRGPTSSGRATAELSGPASAARNRSPQTSISFSEMTLNSAA